MSKQPTPVKQIDLELDRMRAQFLAVLPKHIPVDRFRRIILTAVQNDPNLLNADRGSFWNAAMKAAQDGLLPDGRLGAMVIYASKRGPTVQWLPMISGIRQKVRNSGEVATWEVHNVHEKDLFDYELGDHPRIVHRPARGPERGKIIAAYSIAVLRGGDISREVMWIDEIEAIRKSSKAGESGPWKTHFGEMAKKTVARRHAKVLPMSSDLDDLLRQGDDDDPLAPPLPAERAPAHDLAERLNMLAQTGEGDMVITKVPAEEDLQTDLIDAIDADTGEVSHEHHR
jgi:recombination protein RecT